MKSQAKATSVVRWVLGLILIIVTINAVGGGIYGMTGAKAVPVEWLRNSPFKSYFIPSLLLFSVVGGSALYASIAVFKKSIVDRKAAFLCCLILSAWIITQLGIIGYRSWLQPAIIITTVIIFCLTLLLPQHEL